MDLLKLPKKSLEYVENLNIPLWYHVVFFLSIINTRNFLDIFSDTALVSFKLFPTTHQLFLPSYISLIISLWHFCIFWIALFLIFPIMLSLITKESIVKTLRVIFSFSWIIAITPIVDLILSKGKGIAATFIYPQSFSDMLPLPPALNPGEKITITLGTLLIFIYCRIKTKKLSRSLIGAFLFYFFCMLSFMLPTLIEYTARLIHPNFKIISPLNIIPILSGVIFAEFTFIFYLYNKKFLKLIIKEMGFLKTTHLILFFILGIMLHGGGSGGFIFHRLGFFLLTIIVILLGWAQTTILASLENPNIPQKNTVKKICAAILIAALICASAVNLTASFFLILSLGYAFLYHFPPAKLKRIPFFSKICLASIVFLLVLQGWLFSGGEILEFPHVFTFYILIFVGGCLNFINLRDGTDQGKVFPFLGKEENKKLVGLFFLTTYLLIPLIFLEDKLIWASASLGLLQFCLFSRKNYSEGLILSVNLISFISLLFWINFRG